MQKKEVIDKLKELASKLKNKEYLVLEDVRSVPKLSYYAYYHFRTLGNALKAAGLQSSHLAAKMNIGDSDLLNYLRDLKKELSHNPTVWDIQHDEKIYKKYSNKPFSWSIFKKRFGGLPKANEMTNGKIAVIEREISKKEIYSNEKDFDYSQEKKRFWGKAAELHVTAELLYRGFQAATIPVDVGLDILAVKRNNTFYFQVKHKDLSRNDAIALTKSSFEKSGSGAVYYIFVLLSGKKRDFLIIPFHIVNAWIREGLAEDKDKHYLIYISKKDEKYMLGEVDLNHYLDRWEDIK